MPAAVSEEERRKKSVYYDACTSPFKDDFSTLVKCLKTPEPGNPHTRQEAGFLLWHHALEGDEVAGLLAAGLLTACVANLDSAELLPADKACSAGILLALAGDDEDVAEQLVRTRGPTGRSALEVLHGVLAEDVALARHHCGRLLQALAQLVGPAMVRAMDQQLSYMGSYLAVWGLKQHGDAPAVAAVGELVSLLLVQRPELGPELVAGGAVGALLDVVRHHKSEAAVGAAAQCLGRLLPLEGAVEQLTASGGVPLLVDVLGPPPRGPLENRPEVVQEDEPGSPASEPPSPLPSLLAAVAVAATESPRSSRGGDADVAAAADRASGGGDAAGGESADSPVAVSPAAAESPPAAESSGNRVSFVQHEPAAPSSPSKAPAGAAAAAAAAASSGGSPSGGGSPLGSRFRLSTGAAAGGGEAGGSGWASARSSSRSLGSHPSVNLRAVQLPLVIPGINSPSAAAVAAAAEAGAPLPYPPTALLHSTSRAGRPVAAAAAASAARSEAVASLTAAADGGGDAAAAGVAVAAAAAGPAAPPPLPTADDLAANRSGLRWFMLPGLEVASRAAACLTQVVMQRPSCQVEAELRLASHRLLALVKAVLGPKAAGAQGGAEVKKGSSKRKGLGLTAEQAAALTRLLGLLKFLSLHNITRYRIAKLGAVPILVRLYGEAGDYLLRNHCQAILANVALLAENGVALKEAGTPEEFLVVNPMRLTAYERAVLRIEFPDEPALTPRR